MRAGRGVCAAPLSLPLHSSMDDTVPHKACHGRWFTAWSTSLLNWLQRALLVCSPNICFFLAVLLQHILPSWDPVYVTALAACGVPLGAAGVGMGVLRGCVTGAHTLLPRACLASPVAHHAVHASCVCLLALLERLHHVQGSHCCCACVARAGRGAGCGAPPLRWLARPLCTRAYRCLQF